MSLRSFLACSASSSVAVFADAMYHVSARGRHLFGGVFAPLLPALVVALATPACAPTASETAMSLTRQHREEEGIATLRERLAKRPDDVAARRLLVRLLAAAGDLAGAKAEVEQLERRSAKNDPMPWIELGHAFELSHRYEEALAAYDAAASIAPTSPSGPREGGMRCARWGEVEEAAPRLEEAIRRGARDAALWHALGLVRVHLRDLGGAEQAYRAGAAADPNGPESFLGLATVAILLGDAAKALAAYDAVLERRPRYPAGELGRAWALAKLGRRDEAARALDRAEELGAPRENVAKQRAALAAPH